MKGDAIIQVHLHTVLIQESSERWLFEKDCPVIEVTIQAGLRIYSTGVP